MKDQMPIYTYDFHHPQQNFFGEDVSVRAPEAEFAGQFARIYQAKFSRIHSQTKDQRTLFVREVPVSGNGIADLLVLNWTGDAADGGVLDLRQANPTVRAFEFKLSNWRVGLMQAHRYKYFSHAAILVIPKPKLAAALSYLDLFKSLRVGLWGFDADSSWIRQVYTPRPKRQQIQKYAAIALDRAAQVVS